MDGNIATIIVLGASYRETEKAIEHHKSILRDAEKIELSETQKDVVEWTKREVERLKGILCQTEKSIAKYALSYQRSQPPEA